MDDVVGDHGQRLEAIKYYSWLFHQPILDVKYAGDVSTAMDDSTTYTEIRDMCKFIYYFHGYSHFYGAKPIVDWYKTNVLAIDRQPNEWYCYATAMYAFWNKRILRPVTLSMF